MVPFIKHTGLVVPLERANVDTDQIIPKQFLKRIERTGFGQFLFFDWRYLANGEPNPDFVLNEPRYRGASILVTGKNFGCGSSREHAPWALAEYGVRVVLASSFADIFSNNCFKNGMLPITLADEQISQIMVHAKKDDAYKLTVDLDALLVTDDHGLSIPFHVSEFQRYCLMNGLDDIGLTLQHESDIKAYEDSRPAWKATIQAT